MLSFRRFIEEAVIIGINHDKPIKDTDTIRVYHGAYDALTVYQAVTKGISASRPAARRYSYEMNNNPIGLFVTPDLKTAKEFGDTVMEFHVRVRDLQAPVWPSGSFTVQGQMAQMFRSDDEREQERLRRRLQFSKSEFDFVRKSDRPEVAASLLLMGERQALFVGDLNPNSIRAVWISPNTDIMASVQDFKRISRREFIKLYEESQIGYGEKVPFDIEMKPIKPRDDVSGEEFIDAVLASGNTPRDLTREEIAKIFVNNPDAINDFTWNDRQANRIRADLKRDYL